MNIINTFFEIVILFYRFMMTGLYYLMITDFVTALIFAFIGVIIVNALLQKFINIHDKHFLPFIKRHLNNQTLIRIIESIIVLLLCGIVIMAAIFPFIVLFF